jgi:hypothetical protein
MKGNGGAKYTCCDYLCLSFSFLPAFLFRCLDFWN